MKAELFKALAHPVRIRALELLCEGDRTVSALLAEIGIEASHLSQHLGVLRRADVVRKARQGNSVTYTLVDQIGRASCREREELSVEGDGDETKNTAGA